MEERNNGYVVGLIGAVIGAVIGAIPYLVVYIKFDLIVEFLTFFIPAASFYGYKLANGKMTRRVIAFILLISILVFMVFQLLLAPLWMLHNEGYTASMMNINFLYSSSDFKSAMAHDFFIGLIFTVLGIILVASQIYRAIRGGNPYDIKLTNANTTKQDENLMEAFISMQAIDKYSAVEKEEIQNMLGDSFSNASFRKLVMQQIIRKSKGKYYFSQKTKDSFLLRFALLYAKIMLFVILIVLVILVIVFLTV